MFLRDKETHDAIEEVELRSLELQAHFSRMEQAVLQRNSLTMTRWRDEHQIDKDCIDFNSVEGLTDNTHGKEVVDLATLQIDRYCDLDERLRDVLREIRDLQREIKHQSIESEDQLQSEENKLENTMSKFMSSEVSV
jgi:DNA-binding protein H-NS